MQRPAGIKRLERKFRRLRLYFFQWFYEVTGPRYALHCFVTHVETRSPPVFVMLLDYGIWSHCADFQAEVIRRRVGVKVPDERDAIEARSPSPLAFPGTKDAR